MVPEQPDIHIQQINLDTHRILFEFGWWAQNVVYRSCIIEMYTGKLYDSIEQCHPNKFLNS